MTVKSELSALFPVCTVLNEKIFYITDGEHIFEKLDTQNGIVEYIEDPKGYKPREWSGTDRILVDEKYIYLLEQNGKHIMKYSLLNHECEYIDLNCNDYVYNNFAGAVIYNGMMYIFPRYRDGVVKVDLKSDCLVNKDCLCPDIEYCFNEKEEIPSALFACSYQIENHMWIFTEKARIVIDYNISEEQFDRYVLPESIKSCVRVVYKYGVFYILTIEGKIFTWSPDGGSEQELYDFGQKEAYPYFATIIIAGELLWVLPFWGKDICVIKLKTGKCVIYNSYPADFGYFAPDNWGKYYFYCSDKNHYYFAMHSGNYILTIDKKSGQEQWIKPRGSEEEKNIFYLRNSREKLTNENLCFDMLDFIKILKKNFYTQEEYKGNNVGLMIWNTIKGE